MTTFSTINPATEAAIRQYEYADEAQLTQQIDLTHDAWRTWKTTGFSDRGQKLSELSRLLNDQKTALAALITTEMGKPLNQSESEIEKCAWVCGYYAEHGEAFMQKEVIATEATESYVQHAPLGVVLAIMPWNFPFWQVFRFLAPALMAGNAGLLKHSPNTAGCALKIEELVAEAGFPTHLFSTILADIPQIEGIIAHPKVSAVTLTGSTRAGKSVAALAGKYLKKTVLELGGSDPYLILDDADIQLAGKECVTGRLLNTGQSCIAAKRFIVTERNARAFTEEVKRLLATKTYGDPLSGDFDLGAMARSDLRDQLHQQVSDSVAAGAQCVIGGQIPEGKGFFYPVTLLTEVKKGMPAYDEELFGPVSVIITAEDEEEAILIANDTSYGLGSAVFSRDIEKAREIAENQLEAGSTFINTFVKSDPRLPFGGIKDSGYGRELSPIGMKEFVNIKTVYIQ